MARDLNDLIKQLERERDSMLLASLASPSRPQSERGPIVAGDGSYGFEVFGQESHQEELEAIVGGRSWKAAEHECLAVLLPEPSNAYGLNAVCVVIAGRKVGYLPRNQAAAFKRALNGGGYALCACHARIVGGWNRGKNDRGHFRVKLDIMLPISIWAAAVLAPERIDHPNIRPKQIAHGTNVKFRQGTTSVGLAVAAAFAIWLASMWWTTAPQSPSISNATSRLPSQSEATAQLPSISEATSRAPSLSEATAQPQSISEATAQSPSTSEATAQSPSISDVTTRVPSTSEVWRRVDAAVWERVVDAELEATVTSSVPIPRPVLDDVPMPRSRPQQNF